MSHATENVFNFIKARPKTIGKVIALTLNYHIRTVNKALRDLQKAGRIETFTDIADATRTNWSRAWSVRTPRFDAPLHGMALFDHNSTGYLELQREDDAEIYPGDDEAWAEFIATLKGESIERDRAIRMAVQLLENWREPMAAVMRGEYPHPDGTNISMKEKA